MVLAEQTPRKQSAIKKMCKNKLPCDPDRPGRDIPRWVCVRMSETVKPLTLGDVEGRSVAPENEVVARKSFE